MLKKNLKIFTVLKIVVSRKNIWKKRLFERFHLLKQIAFLSFALIGQQVAVETSSSEIRDQRREVAILVCLVLLNCGDSMRSSNLACSGVPLNSRDEFEGTPVKDDFFATQVARQLVALKRREWDRCKSDQISHNVVYFVSLNSDESTSKSTFCVDGVRRGRVLPRSSSDARLFFSKIFNFSLRKRTFGHAKKSAKEAIFGSKNAQRAKLKIGVLRRFPPFGCAKRYCLVAW